MFTNLPVDKIIQAAKRFGADFVDVFVESTHTNSIICDNNKLEQAATISDTGVGIRVIAEGHTAYGSTNDLTKRSLLNLAKKVGQAAKAVHKRAEPIHLNERSIDAITTIKMHPYGIPLEDKCNIVTRANEIAWKAGSKISQVKISYRDVVRRILVASSEGIFASDEQVRTMFAAQVIAGDGSCLQTGFEPIGATKGFEIFDDHLPEEVAEIAAKRALKMLAARPAPAGKMPVILSSEAGGTMIHEAVGHGLEGDIAGEGLSVYSGRLGEMVASPLITVIDDATIAGRRGSFSFDDEGHPAERSVLIEDGVLKRYMSDCLASMRYDYSSTGNGRRQNYATPPIVRMTNTFIAPGEDEPEAILKETTKGIFVKRMGGGQVNTVNGDFVFGVQECYLIEDGQVGEPVRGATLIGNGPKVLSEIDRVGSDLGFSIGTCGKKEQEAPVSCGQPTIRIPELVVGGTV